MRLDRDKFGVCDDKPRVISLITVHDPENQTSKKKGQVETQYELDILIHCEAQSNYDDLFKALKKVRKHFDDTIYIGDTEARRDYLKCLEVIK